jgi:hypothetical protein
MAYENVTRPQVEPLHLSPVGWEAELAELGQRQALARELGGKDRVARQHADGWRRPRGHESRFVSTGLSRRRRKQ